ncbi:1,4-alpha-glucan branching enzyme [Paenibacillus curdlanolyticus YK9]|uniref:1,4-alpha-glucan branching enzyme GlgB n=1 Tax=Paenibacillus curdlanolyticus YK9 TaxID=717606 RepID=E0ICN8_9BACL|nr:1,4-alpha-glucan branching protein GlgB [Paenibacillus curdlanolyticus]EFM09924.1 1,4-alpha-glucan branching enzyme [Paenibacillus curdlanolyticus YK9]
MPRLAAPPYGITMHDLYLYNEGALYQSYRTFGAHRMKWKRRLGVRFTVWAPNAVSVGVAGDFNDWDGSNDQLERFGTSGVWSGFIPGLKEGARYKYEIIASDGTKLLKADPYAFGSELRPNTASVVTDLNGYEWNDSAWMDNKRSTFDRPLLIYEVHAGSWKIHGKEQFLSYSELADQLVDYAASMGYTHIELMPLAEHPFDRSWGYQITGFYAATSRYGSPKQLMHFVDRCHQMGLGVILDWVPGHFVKDEHGLREFDGTPLYEGPNWRKAEKPLWGTLSFDFGRSEVVGYLISNALFWLDYFHIDGLRVDAVAHMVDLHMDKPPDLCTLNPYGGKEDLDALRFLRTLNEIVFHYYPETLMIAEDSSAQPAVTSPTYLGGLGFNYKWNMGWMNDILRYMLLDPADRKYHHNLITFSLLYAFSENYVLPLSHDEVVHGKRSLLHKMPGSYEDKFAQLRLLYGYWMTHPGKKLLFMGSEWGQFDEWKDLDQLDWMILDYPLHASMHRYVRRLNGVYRSTPALWECDREPDSFRWIDVHNTEQSVISYERRGRERDTISVVICNFSNHDYGHYRVGVPEEGFYELTIHSGEDGSEDSGTTSAWAVHSDPIPYHGRDHSIEFRLMPFSFLLFTYEGRG